MCALTNQAEPRFVVDRSLGRLARWLRRLGFDAVLRADLDRSGMETLAAREGRVLVTRSAAGRREPARATTLVLTSAGFRTQLREIDRAHPLGGWQERAARCLACNVLLAPAGAGRRCPRCHVTLRAGGHHARMEAELRALSLRAPGAL